MTILLAVSVLLFVKSSGTDANGEQDRAGVNADPGLVPPFRLDQSDYAIRCPDKGVKLKFDVPDDWQAGTGSTMFGPGAHEISLDVEPNQARQFRFTGPDIGRRVFNLRCLPADFPPFKVKGSGGPRLTMVELKNYYAAAFDSAGAPVWWYKAQAFTENAQFMPGGTFSYAPIEGAAGRQFDVRTLEGRLVRRLTAANGLKTDLHDLIQLPNGNFLIGAHRMVPGIDTSRFGGKADSTIDTAQVQEIRPDGSLVWKWDAWPRIGLAETGRWWKQIRTQDQPYDIHHWNSIERRGNQVLLSFRHLDAVLKINRRTGKILWKLGGTETPQRLRITGDKWGRYPFGGQHDARSAPGGSVTLFDNSTDMSGTWKNRRPRAVRYRIDAKRGRAELIDQVTEPGVTFSIGFGSARLFGPDKWVVGWGAIGGNGLIGSYGPGERRGLSLRTPGGVSYRANEVSSSRPSIARLRRAMDRVYSNQG